jgi:hypothetical protein
MGKVGVSEMAKQAEIHYCQESCGADPDVPMGESECAFRRNGGCPDDKITFETACNVLFAPLQMALEMGMISGPRSMIDDLDRGLKLLWKAQEEAKKERSDEKAD